METEDEKVAEQEATKEIKEEEVRAKVIEEFGFDEVDDKERIDKLVTKEVENRKKLSAAIGQKVKHRTDAETLRNDPRLKETQAPPPAKSAVEDIGKLVAQELEKRDLDSLEYSDDLKKEIQRVASVQNISIKAALRDPYIVFKLEAYEKEQKQSEAALSRNHRSSGKTNFTRGVPPKVDFSTAEGQKEYDDWKKWEKAQGG